MSKQKSAVEILKKLQQHKKEVCKEEKQFENQTVKDLINNYKYNSIILVAMLIENKLVDDLLNDWNGK